MLSAQYLRNFGGRRVLSYSSTIVARSLSTTSSSSFFLQQNNNESKPSNQRYFSSSSFDKPDTTYVLSEREKEFYDRGIINNEGLTIFSTLHELTIRSNEFYANNKSFGTYNEETKQFEFKTYKEMDTLINKCRMVLKDIGVEKYGKVGLISNNRWEWFAVATAAFSLNAAAVPMYEAQLPSDWSYIINDSGASVLFVANQDIYDRVHKHVVPSAPKLKSILCFDAPDGEEHSFQTHMNKINENDENFSNESSKLISAPTPDDLANLIYTSGTTGKPKGVELLHSNFASNAIGASREAVEDTKDFVRETDTTLAFLPWAHSYGQTCELWIGYSHGASAAICRGVPFILEDLQLVKPDVLYAVPTLYKRVYDGVQNAMENANPRKKKLMRAALSLGRQKVYAARGEEDSLGFLQNIQYKILDSLVLSKIRDRFGGKLRHGFVAGAACPKEVLDFMDVLGIEIYEGYGLTETSPIICMNAPNNRVPGSVGRPIGGVKVYIIDQDGKPVLDGGEGEICCVGPNVMKGYYNNKEETDKVISVAPDGKSRMFHTGDLGRQDEQGFVRVTGRLKEQYKLENGKYVVPSPIEEAIGMSRFILQVVLYGDNRPHNIVLIVPDWAVVRQELGIGEDVPEEELANDPRVKQLIDQEIHDSSYKLKKFEIPSKWAFIAPCTVANNMLTAKMSIRRHKVIETYKEIIENLYGGEESANQDKAAA